MKTWLIKMLIALDYFANAFAPASPPGMTISSHAAMAAADGRLWGRALRAVLNRIQPDHCELAMVNDSARAHAVVVELVPYIAKHFLETPQQK